MTELNYRKCSIDKYLLLGRTDAWRDDANREIVINEIISLSKNNYLGMLNRLRNYILGYKIGKLEVLLSKCEDLVCFDFNECEFEKITSDEVITIPFDKGYETFKIEAREDAKKLMMEAKRC